MQSVACSFAHRDGKACAAGGCAQSKSARIAAAAQCAATRPRMVALKEAAACYELREEDLDAKNRPRSWEDDCASLMTTANCTAFWRGWCLSLEGTKSQSFRRFASHRALCSAPPGVRSARGQPHTLMRLASRRGWWGAGGSALKVTLDGSRGAAPRHNAGG